VLIVDDNEDSGDSLALLARSWGREVAVARDGPSALALAQTFQPEGALVDIGRIATGLAELDCQCNPVHAT
jgi:two-component system, sensor histidine kinase